MIQKPQKPLMIDSIRGQLDDLTDATGIYVRAVDDDNKWQNADIAILTKESLKRWLKGYRKSAVEDVVGILLGYGHLNVEDKHD